MTLTAALDALVYDWRKVLRSALRSKRFVVAAIFTFSVGIGLNVTVFSLFDRLLFRPLPFAAAGRLVQVDFGAVRSGAVTGALLPFEVAQVLRREGHSFTGVAWDCGWTESIVPLPGENPLSLVPVPANAMDVLGIRAIVGRSFEPADDTADEVAVLLTSSVWHTRFGGDNAVLSRAWRFRQWNMRVVGILPEGFLLPSSRLQEQFDGLFVFRGAQTGATAGAFARLRDGISIAAAQAEVDEIVKTHTWESPPLRRSHVQVTVRSLQSGMSLIVGPYLWLMSIAVWIVLGLACLNLSTLLLMRGLENTRNTALRVALGAAPWRLIHVAALEAIAVTTAGSVIAIWVSSVARPLLLSVVPPTLRQFTVSPWDLRIVAITMSCAVLAGVLTTVVPAAQLRRTDPNAMLKAGNSGTSASAVLHLGRWLIVAQTALGTLVLVGAVAVLPPFIQYVLRSPGYEASDLFTIVVGHDWPARGEEGARVRTILREVEALPNVELAAAAHRVPFAEDESVGEFWDERSVDGQEAGVTAGFFRTLRTRILAGREFSEDETYGSPGEAILNKAGAQALWPGVATAAVVGRTVNVRGQSAVVVGVVQNQTARPGGVTRPVLFLPITAPGLRIPQSSLPLVVRMRRGTVPDRALLTSRLNQIFPANRLEVRSVESEIAPLVEQPRLLALLFGVLSVIAVLLSAVGLYVVVRCDVSHRMADIAVRIALGASKWQVTRLFVVNTVSPVLLGICGGAVLAYLMLPELLAGLRDAATFSVSEVVLPAGLLVATAIGAIAHPLARAVRVNPVVILRAR